MYIVYRIFIDIVTAKTTDPMFGFERRQRQIDIILLAQKTRKYILEEFFVRFTPSNNAPCLS